MGISDHTVVRVLTSQRGPLLAYIWSIVREPHIIEDVYQDVCLAALERHMEVSDETKLMSWLRAVAAEQVSRVRLEIEIVPAHAKLCPTRAK